MYGKDFCVKSRRIEYIIAKHHSKEEHENHIHITKIHIQKTRDRKTEVTNRWKRHDDTNQG